MLTVADEGCGIDAETLPFIFEPYFSTKGGVAEPSMGLGLSISRRLVEAMGGQIYVDTEYGRGSQFTIDLPLEQSPQRVESSLLGDDFELDLTLDSVDTQE